MFSFRYALAACSGGMSTSGGGITSMSEEERARAWERCRSLMDAMGRLGLKPDRLCFKYSVDAAAKVRRKKYVCVSYACCLCTQPACVLRLAWLG